MARASAATKAVAQVPNTGMDAMAGAMDPLAAPLFKEGVIERVGPGTYDATVLLPGLAPVGCCMLAKAASNAYGASDCTLPVPGSRVLVYLANRSATHGIIVGVIPNHDSVSVLGSGGKPGPEYAGMWELEAGATMGGNPGYAAPVESKQFLYTMRAGAARPLDIMPGVCAVINDQQAGYSVSPLAVTLKAGAKAQVRCSSIDDNVRVVAGLFQFFGPDGTLQAFNDNGYVTEERVSTPYQCERSGMNAVGQPVFKDKGKRTLASGSLTTGLQGLKTRMVPRKRLHSLLGFMGDLLNLFVAKPDPDADVPETADAETRDQGLLHTHVDGSGRLHVRAANGVLFERTDKIPVPKRLREPWDPEGDKDIQPPPPRLPFEWSKEHPFGHSLHFRDANAWRTLQAYWHLHNQSTATGHKDYYLPEESELRVPDDKYDEVGQAEERFADNADRRAAIALEPDGSIILRDAWGSEIIMRGGSIIISAAANIEYRAGKSIIGMGGQDVVLKARDSADITAERKDIRLSAAKNMQVTGKGVLIESTAEVEGVGYEDKQGEDVYGAGIVLKAATSRIMATAWHTHVAGWGGVVVDTFGGDGGSDDARNTGVVEISAGQVKVNAEVLASVNVGKATGVELVNGTATVLAPNVLVAGTGGVNIMRGGDVMVPLQWAPAEGNVYGPVEDRLQAQWERLSVNGEDPAGWLAGFKPSVRSGIIFTYRTSAQYGTVDAAEIGGTKFYVYQPAWAFMAKHNADTGAGNTERWSELPRSGTYPWPGAEARESCYVTLPEEVNVESATGVAKRRDALSNKGAAPECRSFDELEVIP